MKPQQPHLLGDLLAGGDRHAGVAHRREVLGREERERGHVAVAAGPVALEGRPEGLGGVLDQRDPMPVGQLPEGAQVGGLAEDVDGHHGPRALRDRRLGRVRVEAQGHRVDVGEHRRRAAACDRLGGREERVGGGHDLVPGADAERLQAQLERIGAVCDGHRVPVADRRRHLHLERPHVGAEDEPAGVDHVADELLYLGQQILVLRLDVHQRNRHKEAESRRPTAAVVAVATSPRAPPQPPRPGSRGSPAGGARCPSWRPRRRRSRPAAKHHGRQPRNVSTENRSSGIRATPAGSEMNVRTSGTIRAKNTTGVP